LPNEKRFVAAGRCGRGCQCDIDWGVKPLYSDPPTARLRYSQALAAFANNPKTKLSKADRAELRRLATVWASTVSPESEPRAK
jgi:hypothetical protein